MRPLWIFLLLFSGCLGLILSVLVHWQSLHEKNIAVHTPLSFVKQLKNDPEAGRKIYNEFCSSCHAQNPVLDVKAPIIGDKKAWEEYKKMGIDQLLAKTIAGEKAMPARGGCFECSDEQLRETIEFMINEK